MMASYAVYANSGTEKWRFTTGGWVRSPREYPMESFISGGGTRTCMKYPPAMVVTDGISLHLIVWDVPR